MPEVARSVIERVVGYARIMVMESPVFNAVEAAAELATKQFDDWGLTRRRCH